MLSLIPEGIVPSLAIAALVAAALALLVALWALLRTRRLGRSRGSSTPGDASLVGEAERIDRLARQLNEVAARLDVAEAQGKRSIQHIGVVRYNPFEDTGSNQSFALAMLDPGGDGFVLSSLHSRQQTRIFIKPVAGGRSETALSDEEAEAIQKASTR